MKTDMDKSIWNDSYPIHSYDVGPGKQTPLPVLCRFLQESAYRNAHHLGFGYDQLKAKRQFWVLSRLLVKIQHYPTWNDTVKIYTWPVGVERLFAYRDFELYDQHDRYLGAASSAWLILDSEKRRPQRPEDLAKQFEMVSDRHALDEKPEKLPALEDPVPGAFFPVRFSDLDLYDHVNNARYIQWIVDHYSPEMHRDYRIASFEINFLAEARFGDQVQVLTQTLEENSPSFLHGVNRKSDNRDICLAKVKWQPTS